MNRAGGRNRGAAGGDTVNQIYVFGSGHAAEFGPGITVRSGTAGGFIGSWNSNNPVTLQGTITSDLPGRTVGLGGVPLQIEGGLNVATGSVINFGTDYTLASSATIDVDIGGTADFGRLTALNRTANLDGTLNIALVNGFMPVLTDTFQIADRQNKSPTGSTPGLGAGAAEGSTSVNRAGGRNRGACVSSENLNKMEVPGSRGRAGPCRSGYRHSIGSFDWAGQRSRWWRARRLGRCPN